MTYHLAPKVPADEPADFNTTLLVGPLILAANISFLLAGLNISQCISYFRMFRDDKRWTRISVLTVCIMDASHFILITALMYYLFSINWGNPIVFSQFPWYYAVHCFFTAIVHVAVQSQYIHRVSLITRSRLLSTSCMILLTTRIIGLVVLGVLIAAGHVTSATLHRWIRLGSVLLGVGAAGDVLVAGSLGVWLWRGRRVMISSRRGFVDSAMVVIIQTGLLTSLSSLTYLIILILYPYTSIWPGLSFIVPRVYGISLTTSLNNRTQLRDQAQQESYSIWGTASPRLPSPPKSALVFAPGFPDDTRTQTTRGIGLGAASMMISVGEMDGTRGKVSRDAASASASTMTWSSSDIGPGGRYDVVGNAKDDRGCYTGRRVGNGRLRVDSIGLDRTEKGVGLGGGAEGWRSNPELKIPNMSSS